MWKVKGMGVLVRLIAFVKSWHKRMYRLLSHILSPLRFLYYWLKSSQRPNDLHLMRPIFWPLGLILLLLDVLGIPEIYESFMDLIKWRSRPLSDVERSQCQQIFGDQIAWSRVRIDSKAIAGPKQWRIAYVSFYTINSWGELELPILIHEMVHIWQFEKFGSLYIPLALQAQLSKAGYDYGGEKALMKKQEQTFYYAFNFEQQAEIVEDFYRSKKGLPLQWSRRGAIANHWLSYWVRKSFIS